MRVIVGVAVCALAGCNLVFTAAADPDAAGVVADAEDPDAPIRNDSALPIACPATYDISLNGSRYRFEGNGVTWLQAQTECMNDGAQNGSTHLAVLDSAEELNMLHATTGIDGTNVWIGLTDVRTEGVFRAIVFSPPEFPKDLVTSPPWAGGQPDDMTPGQDCVYIQSGGGGAGLLVDEACSVPHGYVCECDRNMVDADGFPPSPAVK